MTDFQRGFLVGVVCALLPLAWGAAMAWLSARGEISGARVIPMRRGVERARRGGSL